jgi:YD repeat-containing protein
VICPTPHPFGQVTTYDVARDTVSDVPKVTRIQGDCPACGLGPNAQLTYADAVNPLLPTQMTDGRGLVTQYAYNSKGQMTSRTEAAGTPLARMTIYDYADRLATLLARRTGQPDQFLVNGAAYLPSGPLSSLTLGNGLTETHVFTNRYFPSAITLGSQGAFTRLEDAVRHPYLPDGRWSPW